MVAKVPGVVVMPATIEDRWYLRPLDVEVLSGIAASTVRAAIYRGDLPARKFRRRGWLIDAEDARAWLEAESTPSRGADDGAA
jgi:hypothetical protein